MNKKKETTVLNMHVKLVGPEKKVKAVRDQIANVLYANGRTSRECKYQEGGKWTDEVDNVELV